MYAKINNSKLYINNIFFLHIIIIITLLHTSVYAAPGVKTKDKWVIVLDAGHGGADAGASGSFSKEKNVTLAVALLTGKYLEALDNVEVVYTRKTDVSVGLKERPVIANKANADLFVSIHANATKDKRVSGTETFIMGLAKDEASLNIAMAENQVIMLEEDYSTKYSGFDPKSPESYIIFTLTHNLYQQQSTNLASSIQKQFRERVGRKDRGVKQAGFWVLFNTSMPSVLTEIGFISNPAEEKFINSKQGQEYIASAIFRACRDYINEISSKSSISIKEQKDIPDETKADTITEKPIRTHNSENEIIFMVQILTSGKKVAVNSKNFKGLNDIHEIREPGRYKYATGRFSTYKEAVKYRKKIESLYPDAFVIAFDGNKILPLQQVLRKK